jgi:hypothetical protein
MQYTWLEQMVKEGQVRKEAAAKIYDECQSLVKQSNADPGAIKGPGHGLLTMVMMGGMLGGAGVLAAGANKAYQHLAVYPQMKKTMDANLAHLKSLPEFADYHDKVSARVKEISQIAPVVALNKNLLERMVRRTLHEGLSDDDVDKLALLQSQHTPKLDEQREMIKKLGSVRPEVVGTILADVHHITKTAKVDWGKAWKSGKDYAQVLALMTGIPLLGGAVTGAVNAAGRALDNHKLKKNLENSYTEALKLSDPDKEPLHAEPEKARQAFEALAHFSPHVALQPQAARAFMSKIVSYNQGMNISDVKDLTEIERNMAQKTPNAFMHGLVEGSKHLGISEGTSQAQRNLSTKFMESVR